MGLLVPLPGTAGLGRNNLRPTRAKASQGLTPLPGQPAHQKVVKATVLGPDLEGPPDWKAWSPRPTLMLVNSDWPATPRCSSRLPAQGKHGGHARWTADAC